MSLTDLLQRLEHWLQTHRPNYYKTVNPGIDLVELDRFQNYLGKALQHSFWQLYLWHNGINGEMSFQNNRFFMPLSRVQESHEILTGMIGADWIPILEVMAGTTFALTLADLSMGSGQVFEFWHDNDRTNQVRQACFEDW